MRNISTEYLYGIFVQNISDEYFHLIMSMEYFLGIFLLNISNIIST